MPRRSARKPESLKQANLPLRARVTGSGAGTAPRPRRRRSVDSVTLARVRDQRSSCREVAADPYQAFLSSRDAEPSADLRQRL